MDAVLEESAVGKSQANGLPENALSKVKPKIRMLKKQVEELHKVELGVTRLIYPWLLEFAATSINLGRKGPDGPLGSRRQSEFISPIKIAKMFCEKCVFSSFSQKFFHFRFFPVFVCSVSSHLSFTFFCVSQNIICESVLSVLSSVSHNLLFSC